MTDWTNPRKRSWKGPLDQASCMLHKSAPMDVLGFDAELPPPLSLQEEQELACIVQDTQLPRDTRIRARNKLVRHNLQWVLSILRPYKRGMDYDAFQDLTGQVLARLPRDAERFEPRGVRFVGYLSTFIPHSISSLSRQLCTISTCSQREREEATLRNIEGEDSLSPEDAYFTCELHDILEEASKTLDERRHLIVRWYFGLDSDVEAAGPRNPGLTQDEIGARLNISRERVRVLLRTALSTLEKRLKRKGITRSLLDYPRPNRNTSVPNSDESSTRHPGLFCYSSSRTYLQGS